MTHSKTLVGLAGQKPYPKGEHRLVCLQATQPKSVSTGFERTLSARPLLLIRALAVTK